MDWRRVGVEYSLKNWSKMAGQRGTFLFTFWFLIVPSWSFLVCSVFSVLSDEFGMFFHFPQYMENVEWPLCSIEIFTKNQFLGEKTSLM